MKKRDLIAILLILSIAILSYSLLRKTPTDIVKISVDGKLYMTVSLDEDREIYIAGTNVAQVKNGEIFMKSATCPDKLCIHQGAISDSSKKIICLPNKVIIEALENAELDMVVN